MDFKHIYLKTYVKLLASFVVAVGIYLLGIFHIFIQKCENDVAPISFALIGFILTTVSLGLVKLWRSEISFKKKVLSIIITGLSWAVILYIPFLLVFASLGSDSC